MTKTVSARITNQTHEKLIERCNQIGCSVNEYLNGAIEFGLTGTTQQDLGDEIDDTDDAQEESPKTLSMPTAQESADQNKEIPKLKNVRISYDDGKTWIHL